jgi:hypothetical protein
MKIFIGKFSSSDAIIFFFNLLVNYCALVSAITAKHPSWISIEAVLVVRIAYA